jgi:hypothetical protein
MNHVEIIMNAIDNKELSYLTVKNESNPLDCDTILINPDKSVTINNTPLSLQDLEAYFQALAGGHHCRQVLGYHPYGKMLHEPVLETSLGNCPVQKEDFCITDQHTPLNCVLAAMFALLLALLVWILVDQMM